MNFETIIYRKKKYVSEIILNRPDSLNALNKKLSEELEVAINTAAEDSTVRVLVFSGKGRSFSVGADVSEIKFTSPKEAESFLRKVHILLQQIEYIEKPSIASINGLALGGGYELALACDIRIACESSLIGLPEIKMGFLPGGGGTQKLPRLVGIGNALEIILTGESINAHEAHRLGLVNRVVPDADLTEEVMKLADILATRAPDAMKMAKKLIKIGANMDLNSALEYEIQCVSYLTWHAVQMAKNDASRKGGNKKCS